MTSVRPVSCLDGNEPYTVYGFRLRGSHTHAAAQQPANLSMLQSSLSGHRGRSLLSERLLNKDATVYECMPDAFECSLHSEDDCTDDGCTFEAEESWSFLDGQESSVQESDRLSHASSQPIAIPASCYFKDEVQRQALDKLNQKRKWYQQQLEAERMMARSMAKSRQAAAAARGNKPSGRPGAPA